jgi:hypothetical protein
MRHAPTIPFLFDFAQLIPQVPSRAVRYDLSRQVSQTLVDGVWIDSVKLPSEPWGSTKVTDVRQETTDDQ